MYGGPVITCDAFRKLFRQHGKGCLSGRSEVIPLRENVMLPTVAGLHISEDADACGPCREWCKEFEAGNKD